MVATSDDVAKVAGYGWLQPGEFFQRIFHRPPGYLVSTVAGRTAVPHEPIGEVPKCTAPAPDSARIPSELVGNGGFMGEEWVHDEAIAGWATASDSGELAASCADVYAAGNGHTWLVGTNQRLAVVIPARCTDLPPERIPPPAPLPGLSTSLITWWQQPPGALHGVADLLLGVTFGGLPFSRLTFADGSTLLLRQELHSPKAAHS